ncbi:MAG: DNA-binding protein [Chloroflexota bacterium]|nr:DNA-binding protein [Chloroflexota bacterium]
MLSRVEEHLPGATVWEAKAGRAFVGRLHRGTDLVEGIQRFCVERSINAAWLSAIGAVERAAFAYYNLERREYGELSSETHHEITSLSGNVSVRDGRPFVHAHASFADDTGAVVGGHLMRGTIVFLCEFTLREMSDVLLVRSHDEETGLAVW